MRLECCTHAAMEVDHITPTYMGGTDDASNLRAVCPECHKVKSESERLSAIRYRKSRRKLPKETPPGLVVPRA